jgi:gliding motility-associated-like protein
MKAILVLLLFIPFWCNSQQVVELCSNEQTSFVYSSTVNTPGTYTWSINGIPVSNIDDYTVDWAMMGIGTYTLETQFDNDGCVAIPVIYIVNVVECQEGSLYTPNAFTPGSDQLNNVWKPEFFNCRSVHYIIYNRWGEMLFESYDPSIGWDGTYRNHFCKNDVYVYVIDWVDIKNRRYRKCGHITLIN